MAAKAKETTAASDSAIQNTNHDEELKETEVRPDSKYLLDADQWNDLMSGGAESFGGQSPILIIKPGEAVGPIQYNSRKEVPGDRDGETMISISGLMNNKTHRLPLSASFTRACEEAHLIPGDTFYLRRHEDVIKQKGKGKGQAMAIYEVLVVSRAPRPQAAQSAQA